MAIEMRHTLAALLGFTTVCAHAQPTADSAAALEAETLKHFQALVRMDTQSPPGNEKPAADYVAQVLEAEGIPVQVFARSAPAERRRAPKGNGSKRPLLMMGHTDTVNVDPAKWQHPPFSAAREGGHIYGRGTVDDKDSVTAGLMTMLRLKRNLVALDRDVIFLAEAGEEGNTDIGIEYMVNEHFDSIDAEYCLAEGGNATRVEAMSAMRACRPRRNSRRASISLRTASQGTAPCRSRATRSRGSRARSSLSRSGSRPSC